MTSRQPVAPMAANEGALAMTQTCESTSHPTPTRRRASTPLPVLISIPNLATASRSPRPRPRRRRLRREVRVAGYALLAILPFSMAFLAFGADGLSPLAATSSVEHRATSTELDIRQAPVISLAPLEPVITVRRDLDTPVILPGILLPADTPEESSDGGH